MKKSTAFLIIFLIALTLLVCTIGAIAQTPVKQDSNGNYYTVKSVHIKDTIPVSTGKTYTDSKGIIYPVYKSINGKLYIIRISRNTGNEYKQYLKL